MTAISAAVSTFDNERLKVVEAAATLGATTWSRIDLTDALDGRPPEPPALLIRSDGTGLIYQNRVHWLQGQPEEGKSWVALEAVRQSIEAGDDVLLIDLEDSARGIVERLQALGLKSEAILEHLDYRQPEEPLFDRYGAITAAGVAFEDEIADRNYALVVIDGVTESLSHHGVDLNDNTGIATWMNRLPKMIARLTGAAVIAIDHVTKSSDERKHFAIGGQHKLAGIDGAAYGVKMVRPFGRALAGEPIEGLLELTLAKDRMGWIRGRYGKGDVVASVSVTAYPDGGVTIQIDPPPDAGSVPRDDVKLQASILEYLVIYEAASKTSIEGGVTGNIPAIRGQLTALVARGFITVTKLGQAHNHTITDEGRAWLNED